MSPSKRFRPRPKLLSSSRPGPSLAGGLKNNAAPSFNKAKSTRTVIRNHHTLLKRLAASKAANDAAAVSKLEAEVRENGGLETYQQASLRGQGSDRGGDSSKALSEWVSDAYEDLFGSSRGTTDLPKLRLLEVGALDPDNAVTRLPYVAASRIDLHSQHRSILTQDFMLRPAPVDETDLFEVVSLSLVLNYVADPVTRGKMLRRCAEFLSRKSTDLVALLEPDSGPARVSKCLPLLFLVLPLPCVDNSRYFTWDRLLEIMMFLGFAPQYHRRTRKLSYSLWKLEGDRRWDSVPQSGMFRKSELNPGKGRNNFCVVLE